MVPAAAHADGGAAHTVSSDGSDAELQGALGASGLLVFAGIFNVLGNVGFQALVARSGEVAIYGVASGLFAVAAVSVFLAAGLQYSVGRVASLSDCDSPSLLRQATPGLYPWITLSALGAAVSPVIAGYLHLATPVPVILTVAYSLLMVAAGLPAGILVGRRRFGAYTASVVISVVARLGTGGLFAKAMPGVDGALLASIFAAAVFLVALLFAAVGSRPLPGLGTTGKVPSGVRFGDSIPGSVVAGLLWLQWTFPLIAARHVLPGPAVGNFGAANLFAGGIIVLAGPLTTVLYPSLVRSRGQRVLKIGLGATSALCILLGAGLVLVGPFAIQIVYGGRYHVGASVLALLALSAAITTLWTYLLWVLRARANSLQGVLLVSAAAVAAEALLSWLPLFQTPEALAALPAVALSIGSAMNALRHLERRRRGSTRYRPLVVQVEPASDALEVEASTTLLQGVAVGMMVYNEEATLEVCMRAVLDERDGDCGIRRLVVVTSECTDSSEVIARRLATEDDRVLVISQPQRRGKVAAINSFLSAVSEPICALVNADTLLAPGSLTRLVEPLRDPAVGMVGGRVVPVNEGRSLPTRMVRLLWDLHHEVSTVAPKLGEVVVFRNTFDRLESMSGPDEVALEFLVTRGGQSLRYVPDALIYNHGAVKLRDLYRHRTRNHRLHLGFKRTTRYVPSTMKWWSAAAAMARTVIDQPEDTFAACALVGIELASRASANLSHRFGSDGDEPWEPIDSAKSSFASDHVQPRR